MQAKFDAAPPGDAAAGTKAASSSGVIRATRSIERQAVASSRSFVSRPTIGRRDQTS